MANFLQFFATEMYPDTVNIIQLQHYLLQGLINTGRAKLIQKWTLTTNTGILSTWPQLKCVKIHHSKQNTSLQT